MSCQKSRIAVLLLFLGFAGRLPSHAAEASPGLVNSGGWPHSVSSDWMLNGKAPDGSMATAAAFPNCDLELGRPGGHRPLNEDYDPSASRLFGGDELADNMNFNAVARESGFWQGTNSGDGYSAWDKLWHNSTVVPVTAIPEPTAVGLFATAMLGLGRWRRGFAAR